MKKSKKTFHIQNYVYFSKFVILHVDAFYAKARETRGFTFLYGIPIAQGITKVAHFHSLGHIGKTSCFRAKLRE